MEAVRREVVAAILEAVGPTLAARTAPILRKVRGKTGPGTAETASGTVIQVGDRYFVLTASHVFDDIPPVSVGLLPRGETTLEDVVWLDGHQAMRLGGGDYDECDVASVEITLDEVRRWRVDPTPLSSLVGYNIQPDQLAILHGYPQEGVELRHGTPTARAEPISFATVGVPPAEWDARYRRPVHQYLRWPGGEVLRTTLDGAERMRLPPPKGMSGCGIWLVPETPGKLLRPDQVRLAGVQYAWFEKTGHVVGNTLGPVANLLTTAYPELADTLRVSLMERADE